jgi:pimeloyl-ACP methyl ester carboxylesterase
MLSVTNWGGSGQPVYFIHGFAADSQSWVANVPAVTGAFSVYGIDLPAHGASHAVPCAATLSGMATQVANVIDTSVPCHLVGHSAGGAVAMLCASLLPVLSVSLVAPVGLGQGVSSAFINSITQPASDNEIKALLQSMVVNKRLISDQVVQHLRNHMQRTGVRDNLQIAGAAVQQADDHQTGATELGSAVASLVAGDIPRQVFWGMQDVINPINQSDQQAFGGEWHIYEDCGHLPQIEHWSRYNDALMTFISTRG